MVYGEKRREKMKELSYLFAIVILISGCAVKPFPKVERVGIEEHLTAKFPGDHQSYIGYRDVLRKKIFYYAHKNYHYLEQGIVRLDFRVNRNGKVMIVEVNKSTKSIASKKLINVAIKSLKQASPFEPFPATLTKSPYLDFTIEVVFAIQK
jgi:hypothetical protein